jgi:hypothetical protein
MNEKTILDEYIDEATKLIRVCIAKKNESQEAKDLEKKCAILWEKLSEEEKYLADEHMLRIQLYLGK